ncbi:MAG: CusA/CzcA family heavy metal efflux RND transporter [candidate division KSB1 bacterium]|nr:CusA/CzcA family heavy metal efflux RND transporter [candidate division KSB1 bacterium]
MINKIIAFSVRNKFVIALFTAAWIAWGLYSLFHLPLNTLPDLTNNQVKVTTWSPDLATEEVERLITYPIELELGNLPGLQEIRSVSKFGLSDITLVFEDKMGMYKPRQLVREKLETAAEKLPPGVGRPSIGPMTTGLGEIYQYVLYAKPGYDSVYTAMDLREIQDWIVKKELINIPGVVGVNTMGGYLKQYEVAVNPVRLRSYNLSIMDIFRSLQQNNANAGGSYIEKNRRAYFIRGEGLTRSLDDIRAVVLGNENGMPLRIGDVATVRFGHAPRFGAFTYNGTGEAVGGKIMMLRGENPADVITNVKERLPRVRAALPEGVELTPFLDRSTLIRETTNTVTENLALGALIVVFVLVLLMGSMRSGLITASVIPLSLLFALGVMYTFDFSANLISLGAVDFGIIVDGALIIVEFIVFQISRKRSVLIASRGRLLSSDIDDITIWSAGRMMRTAFFGQMIILIVFIPILTLTGQEGDMFKPMVITFGSALIGAIILCFTYVPMMSALLLRPEKSERSSFADRFIIWLRKRYQQLLRRALRYRYAVTAIIVLLFAVALFLFTRLGSVFIPQLDEGDFAIHPILQPGTSLQETVEINTRLEQILLTGFPDEVEQVATKIGTGEIPTDPMSLEMAKMIINLKPRDEWTRTDSKNELAQMMKHEMSAEIPGVSFFFSQPIEMLFKHLMTGSTADILLNIYGSDLDTLYRLGNEAQSIIRDIPGAGDLNVQKVVGLPQIIIRYDRDRLALYGLDIETLNRTIQFGYSGATAGIIYEGERQFSQVVRLEKGYRNNPDAIGELYIKRPNGEQVQLKQLADISIQTGPAAISREDVKRKLEVDINVSGRDTETFVREMQSRLQQHLNLPRGYNLTYEGDFKSLQRAKKRLSWVVPMVLGLIFTLLYFTFRSLKQAALVFSAVPLAAIGGVFSLWIRGMPFSISAGIGFIALFGIAVLDGVVLISFFNELKAEGMNNVYRRVYHGTDMRVRPVILTSLTDVFGFLPMAISTSSGAEVQRPLATVVIGGLISATVLTLILLPIIYSFSEQKKGIPTLAKIAGRIIKGGQSRMSTLLLILIIMLPTGACARNLYQPDTRMTLQEAIDTALKRYPAVKAGELQVKQSRQQRRATWDLPDTRFIYEQENPDGAEIWSVEQEFDFPLQTLSRNRAARQQIVQSSRMLEQIRARLKRDVRFAFMNVLYARDRAVLIREQLSVFRDLEKAGRLRYETGDVSILEKVSAEAKYNDILVAQEQGRTDLENYKRELANYLQTDRMIEPAEDELYPLLPDTLRMKESFPGHNSEIRVSYSRWMAFQAEHRATRSESWPDPFFRYSQRDLPGSGKASAFELGFRLPLDIWAEQGRNRAARYEAQIQHQEYRNVKGQIQALFENLLNRMNTLRTQLDYYRDSRLRRADLIMKSAKEQIQAGNIDYLDYVQYFDQATAIRLNYLDVLRDYNRTVIELHYLTGQ